MLPSTLRSLEVIGAIAVLSRQVCEACCWPDEGVNEVREVCSVVAGLLS